MFEFLFTVFEDETRCDVTSDVKGQLKIFERIDHFHENQRKEREREMLLRAAKVVMLC